MRRAVLLLCLVVCIGVIGLSEPAEWTVWQLGPGSYPGDLRWMINGNLFVSLYQPLGIALFEPSLGQFRVWTTDRVPGEFEITGGGIFFAAPRAGQMAWLQPDASLVRFWNMPELSAWPVFVLDGSPGPDDIEIWYLDWSSGRVGVFEPAVPDLADPHLRIVSPTTITVPATVRTQTGSESSVTSTFYPAAADAAWDIDIVAPVVTPPFTEWQLLSPEDPAYGFSRTKDGRIWVSAGVGKPLRALTPCDNSVRLYDLPGAPFVAALAPATEYGAGYAGAEADLWFLTASEDSGVELGVLNVTSGDVKTWPVPGAIDAVSLRVVGDVVWFCDREASRVYRFVPRTATLTWWGTGGDGDSPLYLEPGASGEMWVSFERSGALARLRLVGD